MSQLFAILTNIIHFISAASDQDVQAFDVVLPQYNVCSETIWTEKFGKCLAISCMANMEVAKEITIKFNTVSSDAISK